MLLHTEKVRTCFLDKLFGLVATSMRFSPTPIAPELTRTTLCPCSRRCTTVSTTADKVDSNGWCVVSCTIDDVPVSIPLHLSGQLRTNDP